MQGSLIRDDREKIEGMFSETQISQIKLLYETQGFLHLRQVIPGDMLSHAQVAFDLAAKQNYEAWRRKVALGIEDGRFFNIPNILDQDEVFVDLVDLPTIFSVLVAIVGQDIQLNHTHARLFYPGKTFTPEWHSDLRHVMGFDHAHTLNFMVKIHYYLEDLSPNQGCLAFIPGSHRYSANHPLPLPNIKSAETSDAVIKVVPKAGDAVLFNCHVHHMAQDNSADSVRKSLIYAYSHYWMKHYSNAVPSDVEKYANTHQRRQLFGVDEVDMPYFNRRLDTNIKPPWYCSLLSASKSLVKRTLLRESFRLKK